MIDRNLSGSAYVSCTLDRAVIDDPVSVKATGYQIQFFDAELNRWLPVSVFEGLDAKADAMHAMSRKLERSSGLMQYRAVELITVERVVEM